MSRFVVSVAFLTLVYALVLNSFALWDLAAGVLFSSLLLFATRRFIFGETIQPIASLPQRVFWFVPFAAYIFIDITRGTIQVVLIVLKLRPLNRPGLVALPFEERSTVGIVVWALALSIAPGSFPVDFDMKKRVMMVHFLDASDPDMLRAQQRNFYQRYQRRVFP